MTASSLQTRPQEQGTAQVGDHVQRSGRRWITNAATEFINSLCPSNQYEFPNLEWCAPNERIMLKEAFSKSFNQLKAEWENEIFDRIDPAQYTVSEHRLLAVIERKTLRFKKLFEKIPNKTFIDGDNSDDRSKLAIVPPSGLSKGNLGTALKSLRRRRQVGCVRADRHSRNHNTPSNIYCVWSVKRGIEKLFNGAMWQCEKLYTQHRTDKERFYEIEDLLERDINDICQDVMQEDQYSYFRTEAEYKSFMESHGFKLNIGRPLPVLASNPQVSWHPEYGFSDGRPYDGTLAQEEPEQGGPAQELG